LYAARMLGGRLGIVATGGRPRYMLQDAIQTYGLTPFSVGTQDTGLGVLDLERMSRKEVLDRVGEAARVLVEEKGADCIGLGCAGMVEMVERCESVVKGKAQVVDGVRLGVQFLVALVQDGKGTAKGGLYMSAAKGRETRGQDWV